MKPFIVLCAFVLATLAIVPTADARRGQSCRGGACAAPAKVFTADLKGQPRAPAGGIVIDGKHYDGGQFIPAPKAPSDAAPASHEGDACESRGPVRKAGKAVGSGLRKVLPPYRRGCGRRGC